jgi:integrase
VGGRGGVRGPQERTVGQGDDEVEQAGLADAITFHGLRHTCATPMLKIGVKVVSERLGHADVALKLNVYSYVLPGMQEKAARKIGDMLA